MTKVTIRYTDDSISVIDVPMGDDDDITVATNDEYFTLDDSNNNSVGWIVRENVKYVIIGELIDNFTDKSKPEETAQ